MKVSLGLRPMAISLTPPLSSNETTPQQTRRSHLNAYQKPMCRGQNENLEEQVSGYINLIIFIYVFGAGNVESMYQAPVN